MPRDNMLMFKFRRSFAAQSFIRSILILFEREPSHELSEFDDNLADVNYVGLK